MAKPSVLMLYNKPLLPKEHPDADSEHTVVEVAEEMMAILAAAGFRIRSLALGSDPALLWTELKKRKPDVVFNLFEGNLDNTETESFVAGLLEWSGIPYTGSPFAALSLARAKHTTKYLLKGAGLPTADFLVVSELPMPACSLAYPVIVKPATQDASVGMDQESVCVSASELERRVHYILANYGAPVIIEEYIPGRELNVSLVEVPELQVLPPAEVVLPAERPGFWPIYTYNGKWKAGTSEYEGTSMRIPTDLSGATLRKLNRLAMAAYRLLGCRDYARVDFRITPKGKPYILEVNPNPDISEQLDLTGCLGSVQLSHGEFIVRLVHQALQRGQAPKPAFTPVRSNGSAPIKT
jgi:D-alanine-D-alanine ligase